MSIQKLNLFYSYSHEDEIFRDELEKHLTVLRKENIINVWHDRKISPGSNWEEEINENLTKADIILLLISSNFLASDYCYDVETVTALEMHEENKAVVIPVIVQPCLWQNSKLGKKLKLQVLPTDGKAITSFQNPHEGWVDVAEGILKVALETPYLKRLETKVLKESEKSDVDIEELVLEFLKDYSQWYFSPLRIVKWGGRQKGYGYLDHFESNEIRNLLKKLEKQGKLKKKISQKGNPIYKFGKTGN